MRISFTYHSGTDKINEIDGDQLYLSIMLSDAKVIEKKLVYYDGCFRSNLILNHYHPENDIFSESIRFNAYLYTKKSRDTFNLKSEFLSSYIKLLPNTFETLSDGSGVEFVATVTLLCQGYSGINCHMDDIINNNYFRDYVSKKAFCKKIPECQDKECQKHEKCNYGKCYIATFNASIEYCVCKENYYGKFCESKIFEHFIDEPMLLFTPLNQLPKRVESSIDCGVCLKCIKYSEFIICTIFHKNTNINKCLGDCEETCGPDICRMRIGNNKYYYLKVPK